MLARLRMFVLMAISFVLLAFCAIVFWNALARPQTPPREEPIVAAKPQHPPKKEPAPPKPKDPPKKETVPEPKKEEPKKPVEPKKKEGIGGKLEDEVDKLLGKKRDSTAVSGRKLRKDAKKEERRGKEARDAGKVL